MQFLFKFFHSMFLFDSFRSFTQMEKSPSSPALASRALLFNKIGSLNVNNSLEEKIFQLKIGFFPDPFLFQTFCLIFCNSFSFILQLHICAAFVQRNFGVSAFISFAMGYRFNKAFLGRKPQRALEKEVFIIVSRCKKVG